MTKQDIEAIQTRAEALYPGPWLYSEQYDFRYVLSHDNYIMLSGKKDRDEDTLRFCAHARTDIPNLCAHALRLERDVEELAEVWESVPLMIASAEHAGWFKCKICGLLDRSADDHQKYHPGCLFSRARAILARIKAQDGDIVAK